MNIPFKITKTLHLKSFRPQPMEFEKVDDMAFHPILLAPNGSNEFDEYEQVSPLKYATAYAADDGNIVKSNSGEVLFEGKKSYTIEAICRQGDIVWLRFADRDKPFPLSAEEFSNSTSGAPERTRELEMEYGAPSNSEDMEMEKEEMQYGYMDYDFSELELDEELPGRKKKGKEKENDLPELEY